MELIFLDRINSAPLDDDDFSFTFNSWISNTVDSLNEIIANIESQINGLGLTTLITPMTTAQITALIAMDALPVLSVGSLWIDTTINKLRILTVAAVPGVSNGVTEVVTSV
jgi:hypothetical protein